MAFFQNMQTRNELADYLGIPRKKLTHILYVRRVENCYITFSVPKRAGGEREICAPDDELKSIQKNLADKLRKYRESCKQAKGISANISHGFEEKKGIITNARIHRNKRFVINVDLEDFFGSIHFGRVMGFFEKNDDFKMSHEVATAIAQLCCYNGRLPQGAPTSPVISNMICEILDFRLLQIAKKYKLDYTRYADDLTFSTNDKAFLEKYDTFYSSISDAIRRAGFAVNEKKTRLQYRDSKQTVTGLTVNKKLNVDRRYYKETRAMAYSLYKTGEFQINGGSGTLAQLEGRFAFINQLDKYDNKYFQLTKRKSWTLNGRERQYQKFLFYKYFYANSKPLIVTEGKTDVLYIKAALMSQCEKYPNLIQPLSDGRFEYKVSFFRRSKRFRYFFDISLDGADALTKIYPFYSGKDNRPSYYEYFHKVCEKAPEHPVILVFDNELEDKEKPIRKFISSTRKADKLKKKIEVSLKEQVIPDANLYIVTHQLVGGAKNCEIEDLFDDYTRGQTIDGKKLSLNDKYDRKTEYGKDAFSKFVLSNYKTIDFSQFTTLLDKINEVITGEKLLMKG